MIRWRLSTTSANLHLLGSADSGFSSASISAMRFCHVGSKVVFSTVPGNPQISRDKLLISVPVRDIVSGKPVLGGVMVPSHEPSHKPVGYHRF